MAVTVLVLPLVDIQPPGPGETVWEVIGDNAGPISAFLFTFFVVAVMWSTHNRILNGIVDFDGAVFWLNTTWLAAIVLLPWFSAMYGEGQVFGQAGGSSGVGALYWGTMALISLLGSGIAWHLSRNPHLTAEERVSVGPRAVWRGPVFAAYFLLIGLLWELDAAIASWLPLGIIPLSIWLRPGRAPSDA